MSDAELMLGWLARRLYDELEWIATAIERKTFRLQTARPEKPAPNKPGYHGAFANDKQRIIDMYRSGLSFTDIAATIPATGRPWLKPGETLRLSSSMVRYILKREDICV